MKRIVFAFVLTLAACAHGNSASEEKGRSPVPTEQEGPPGSFDVECRFGISGCENKASEQCGYAGYHVISSYKVSGAFGTPYWYMKAACGPG
jgi:hypothetical protein